LASHFGTTPDSVDGIFSKVFPNLPLGVVPKTSIKKSILDSHLARKPDNHELGDNFGKSHTNTIHQQSSQKWD
jgi:hypothetical protein